MADLSERCQAIELLVLDVDGVLTDGVIALDDQGVELKHFHVRDGSAVAFWRKLGKRVAILSGRSAPVVDRRAAELGIAPVLQGCADKGRGFRDLLAELHFEPRQVAFMGDDLLDLPVLMSAGLGACPADAVTEVRERADLVTRAAGGRGAVRELVEVILGHQGLWERLVADHAVPAFPAPDSRST